MPIASIDGFGAKDISIAEEVLSGDVAKESSVNFPECFATLSISLSISAIAWSIAKELPTTTLFTETTWAVLISTVAGISTAFTPIGRGLSTSILANIMLYIIIGHLICILGGRTFGLKFGPQRPPKLLLFLEVGIFTH